MFNLKTLKSVLVVSLLTAGSLSVAAAGTAQAATKQTLVPLSPAEAKTLVFMREEEKLARDVYLTSDSEWGMTVFSNIAASEQAHMDSIARLLTRYHLKDPITDSAVGVFTNNELRVTYYELITRGDLSVMEALRVGGFIEELDIKDLSLAIAQSRHPDVIRVYENLMSGSRNHLRAFVKALRQRGGTYTAQVLTQSEVDAILASTR